MLFASAEAVTEAAETTLSELEQNLEGLTELPKSTEEASVYFKNLINMLEEFAVTYGGKLIIAIILMIIGFKLVNLVSKKLGQAKLFKNTEASTRNFFTGLISIVFKVIIGMTALAVLGIPMSSMIAVIGSCGLAIGLALQGSLSNIAGGFILLILKPFKVGDYITAGDVEGTVEEIGIFSTRVITVDNRRIIVPNATISNATLTNVTALKERRVDLVFKASPATDIDLVEKTLTKVIVNNEKTLKDKEAFARLSAHLDGALEYTVRAWCKTEDYWDVYFALIKEVRLAFVEAGVEAPVPKLTVLDGNK